MGDPREYITPDCVADFTTIHLEQCGPDRVRFSGIHGRPATEFYKVSISYSAGFKAIGALVYAWPDAYKKARASDRILRERLDRLGLKFDAMRTEFRGGQRVPRDSRRRNRRLKSSLNWPKWCCGSACDLAIGRRWSGSRKELAPLALNGPPVVTGFGSGRPKVEEIVAYWPALIPKREVSPEVTLWPQEN